MFIKSCKQIIAGFPDGFHMPGSDITTGTYQYKIFHFLFYAAN
jgi:hypothetical protein